MVRLHLSRLLGERKMTQAELSRLTGIRPNTINDMYHETIDRISLDAIDKLCEALDCSLGELLELQENETKRTEEDLIVEEHKRRKKQFCMNGHT